MSEYMMSLRNDSIHSGDEDLLPKELIHLFGTYQSAAEEYESARCSGLVCPEDLADYGKDLKTAYAEYSQALKTAVDDYQKATASKVIYEPCETEYKDWNDQLQDKKAYSQTDEIETALDIENGNPVMEREEEYEEKNKKDESEESERKHSFFHR
jgi:Na+-translocating ferredoxin:NAD+ oxidoreductase RnfC subunit